MMGSPVAYRQSRESFSRRSGQAGKPREKSTLKRSIGLFQDEGRWPPMPVTSGWRVLMDGARYCSEARTRAHTGWGAPGI
jgi:hypothetical protein